MTSPIFIDANVPIYASGGEHPLKAPCLDVLRLVGARKSAFITSAEVLQELLHRYLALRRWAEGRGSYQRFARVMSGRIESLTAGDTDYAAALADRLLGLSARDLIHLAVMHRIGADTIVSADGGFDRAPGVRRLDPAEVAAWRDEVGR